MPIFPPSGGGAFGRAPFFSAEIASFSPTSDEFISIHLLNENEFESPVEQVVPTQATYRDFTMNVEAINVSGGIDFILRKNGQDTAVKLSFFDGGPLLVKSTEEVLFNQNDKIDFRVVVQASLELVNVSLSFNVDVAGATVAGITSLNSSTDKSQFITDSDTIKINENGNEHQVEIKDQSIISQQILPQGIEAQSIEDNSLTKGKLNSAGGSDGQILVSDGNGNYDFEDNLNELQYMTALALAGNTRTATLSGAGVTGKQTLSRQISNRIVFLHSASFSAFGAGTQTFTVEVVFDGTILWRQQFKISANETFNANGIVTAVRGISVDNVNEPIAITINSTGTFDFTLNLSLGAIET